VERLGWVLVHSLWQFLLLALGVLVLQRALQRCSAAARYGTLLALMCVLVSMPVATWSLLPADATSGARGAVAGQGGTAALSPGPAGVDREAAGPPAAWPGRELEWPAPTTTGPGPAPRSETGSLGAWWSTARDALRPWLSPIVWTWCAGVLVFAMRPLLSWHTVRRLRTAGVAPVPASVHTALDRTAQRLRLRHAVQVLQSTLVQAPVVVGYLRPVILLPLGVVTGLPVAQLEAILAHELAHIRRQDYVVNLLQTLVETVFFYHPAVWWLSRQIRNERENCCDDVAIGVLGNRVDYGRALLALEELRGAATALALGGRGGALLCRVRRILGCEPPRDVFGGGMAVGLGLLAAATVVVWSAFVPASDAPPAPAPAPSVAPEQSSEPPWGPVTSGLRARVLAVSPETDEQRPDWTTAKRQATFARPEEPTLLVELQNAGDRPLSLLGTRYGDEVAPPSPGKSASDRFAPRLFDCEFVDSQGRPVAGPSHRMLDSDAMGTVSAGLAETLKPTESLIVLLRPAKWDASLAWLLAAGDYKVRVRYHGPTAGVLQELKRVWPEKPLASVWTGAVASAEASFRIASDREDRGPELVWGAPVQSHFGRRRGVRTTP
jgi:hypothetical protein